MSRVKMVADSQGRFYGIRFNCPGCALGSHVIGVDWTPDGQERSPAQIGPLWAFNGDLDRPTLTPSVLTQSYRYDQRKVSRENLEADLWNQEKVSYVCHVFVTDGRIQFLGDCTHPQAGRTVDLPVFDRSEP